MQKSLSLYLGLLLVGLVLLTACSNTSHSDSQSYNEIANEVCNVSYARNFSISEKESGVFHLRISNSESKHGTHYDFLLVNKDAVPSDSILTIAESKGYTKLTIPIEHVICMTSLQLSNFIAINATDKVAGISSTRHLFDKSIKKQIADGRTIQIGIEGNFDPEIIMAVSPDIIMISPSKRGGFEILTESGIPVMPHLGYQEPTPLGQAEWIKLTGLLTGHLAKANAYFSEVENNYTRLCQMVKENVSSQPTIMSGDMKGGAWYATGGQSFLAKIFQDAGARYFMDNDTNTGGVNIDFEVVYAQGADADYWRISNSFNGDFTYDELAAQDARFKDFKSWRNRQVVYCNMSRTPFYESFPVHPDLLLSDFIHVFHPELMTNYSPTYYSILK